MAGETQRTENINLSPFIGSTLTLVFVFSTMYTLWALYYVDSGGALTFSGLPEDVNDPVSTITANSGFFGIAVSALDAILELVSWISPMALIKDLLIIAGIRDNTPIIYGMLNLLILRPAGWIMAFLTVNYVVSKIPTVSGE